MYQKVLYFLRAAEKGSFSRAAQELYISPQALTKQIGVLERELGGRLFTRSSRGALLTEFGSYAYRKLGRAAGEFESALRDVRAHAGGDKARCSIGIFSALPRESLVLPLVSFLLARYPNYRIGLEMLELSDALDRFLAGKLDFLLTNIHEQNDLTGYEQISFGRYDAKVIVSLVHPWAIRERVTAEDLKREAFIKMRMDGDHYTVPEEASFYSGIPCREVVEAGNFETMLLLLGQAAGFAVFPLAFMNMEQAQIKSFDYPGEPLRFSTSLLYDANSAGPDVLEIARGIREEFLA